MHLYGWPLQRYHILRIAQYLVHQAEGPGFKRIHELISSKLGFDLLPTMVAVPSDNLEKLLFQPFLFVVGNTHIFGITLSSATRRVHVDCSMGQGITVAFSPEDNKTVPILAVTPTAVVCTGAFTIRMAS